MKKMNYIDLGLPSGTLWASANLSMEDVSFENKLPKVTKFEIPTMKQWLELKKECEWKWNNNGYYIVGKNGNQIFLNKSAENDKVTSYWGIVDNENETTCPYGIRCHFKSSYPGCKVAFSPILGPEVNGLLLRPVCKN